MSKQFFARSAGAILLVVMMLIQSCAAKTKRPSRETDFNFDWKFTLVADTTLPKDLPLDDKDWRAVRLPHDWSVEASFDAALEGATGYLPGGVGIYQKHFSTPANPDEQNIYILFDGVYNNATFFLNGQLLGENPYGYSPVYFDLTDKLKTDGSENVLTVHVDHSRYVDSRWYTGSGIYRNVTLVTVDKLHVPIWGTFVTTPEITEKEATVQLEVTVENNRKRSGDFHLTTKIYNQAGKEVSQKTAPYKVKPGTSEVLVQKLKVPNPNLWELDQPDMYKAVTSITQKGQLVDQYVTPFGIRSLRFDKDQGFFLNGKPTYVKGVCLHHDGGLVGAAVPRGVWERRLQKLKDAGVNAIRTAHNPFSEEFLDICDEMGFLVQNEIFDEMDNPKDKRFNKNEQHVDYISRGYTEHFQQWGKSDLKRTMMRDRNHPSVFQWSIGNEIEWTYPHYQHVSGLWDPDVKGGYWNKIPHLSPAEMKARYEALPEREYVLAETAKRLAGWVKELDTTRPVTANLIIPVASLATGYADALDIVGFSYQIAQYDWSKKHYPHMHFTGNENSGYLSEWNSVIEDPMIFSMYMWTGIDYMGESNERWPQKAWPGDMLDLAGFEKPGYYNFKSIWVNEPQVSVFTQPLRGSGFKVDPLSQQVVASSRKALNWDNYTAEKHWNYQAGDTVLVEVRSNLHLVELFLNGKSLGCRGMSESPDRIFRWAVPFEPGILTARGGFDGAKVSDQLETASDIAGLRLSTDKKSLEPDGYDVAHLVVQLIDEEGRPVRTTDKRVSFEVTGDARLLGVDNGHNESTQDYQSDQVVTHQGKCLAIIQSHRESGSVQIVAKVDGLPAQELELAVKD